LEPERRGLADLAPPPGAEVCPLLNLDPGSYIRWS